MNKAPAFQLYAADFYMDTVGWSATEVGAYFRLLMHEWINGPLPNDLGQLARIAGVDPKTMRKFWDNSIGCKFVPADDGKIPALGSGKIPVREGVLAWENSRLERTRQEQQEYREKQVESGRKGGQKAQEKRKEKPSEPLSKPSSENEPLQSSPSTSVIKDKEIKAKEPPVDNLAVEIPFEDFSSTKEASSKEKNSGNGNGQDDELISLVDNLKKAYPKFNTHFYLQNNFKSREFVKIAFKRLLHYEIIHEGKKVSIPARYCDWIVQSNLKNFNEQKFQKEAKEQQLGPEEAERILTDIYAEIALRSGGIT